MAYAGTTSTSPNPPRLVARAIGSTFGGAGLGLWQYASTHVQAQVSTGGGADGHFTDGQDLGMVLGDAFIVIGSGSLVPGLGPISFHRVTEVTSTGAHLSAGLMVSSAS